MKSLKSKTAISVVVLGVLFALSAFSVGAVAATSLPGYLQEQAPIIEKMGKGQEAVERAATLAEEDKTVEAAEAFDEASTHFGECVTLLDGQEPPPEAQKYHDVLKNGLKSFSESTALGAQGIRENDSTKLMEALSKAQTGAEQLKAAATELKALRKGAVG